MKKILLVAALMISAVSAQAQQFNLGVAGRKSASAPVLDGVLMAPQVYGLIAYGQATLPNLAHPGRRPELTAALERPLFDTRHFYLGIDNGLGFYPTNEKYGSGTWMTGFTSWVPVYKSYGAYGMVSALPLKGGPATIQIGLFKQLH